MHNLSYVTINKFKLINEYEIQINPGNLELLLSDNLLNAQKNE